MTEVGYTDLRTDAQLASALADEAGFTAAYAGIDFAGKWPAASYLFTEGGTGTLLLVADQARYTPLWVPVARTGVSVDLEITSAGVGGTPLLRLGLYSPDAAGRPGTLVEDFGTVDASVAAVVAKVINRPFSVGLHWLLAVPQGATGTQPTVRAQTNYSSRFVNYSTFAAAGSRAGYTQASVSGALPASATPSLTTVSSTVHLGVKAAA